MESQAPEKNIAYIGLIPGTGKNNQTTQDCVNQFKIDTPTGYIQVQWVADGHGELGRNAAYTAGNVFEKQQEYWTQNKCYLWEKDKWYIELENLFNKAHESIKHIFGNEDISGGTTATIVIHVPTKDGGCDIYTANVGDSDAFLFKDNGEYIKLTTDHTGSSESEWKRINSPNANFPQKLVFVYDKQNTIRSSTTLPHVFDDNGVKVQKFVNNPWEYGLYPTNARYEPAIYVISPNNATKNVCIAMSRSLGDFNAKYYGSSAIPSINTTHVTVEEMKNNPICVVASDGIWDSYKYENFGELLFDTVKSTDKDIPSTGSKLLLYSFERGLKLFKSTDDISLSIYPSSTSIYRQHNKKQQGKKRRRKQRKQRKNSKNRKKRRR